MGILAFPLSFQKVMKKAQNLRKTEDFVLEVAPAGGFEPLAFRLGGGRSILLSYAGIWNCTNGIELRTTRL